MRLPEYDHLDALALADLVRRREVSPRELAEAAIERVEARDPALGAVVLRRFERARAEADALAGAASTDGAPLAGVPFLLKDLLADQAGELATSGSRLLRDFRPAADAEVVRRYRAAGLVTLGRTATPELGLLGHTHTALYGVCRNPWNPAHTPGGSSGGSAAAVAARMVPAASGGDGGGSIRIPASACGVFGLKPTRARVPLGPQRGEDWNGLVVLHALTRSVRDSAALLDIAAGAAPGDPYAAPAPPASYLAALASPPPRLRVALFPGALFGDAVDPECAAAVEDAGRLLASLGHDVETAVPEFDRDGLVAAYFTVVVANTALVLRQIAAGGRRVDASQVELVTWFLRQAGERVSAVELLAANDLVHRETRRIAAFFARHDVLVTSTLGTPPLAIGAQDPTPAERRLLRLVSALPARPLLRRALAELGPEALAELPNTALWNQTGQPAMSVPLAWSRSGLPIGIQVVGRFGEEDLLLRLAAELEQARPWAGRVPSMVG